MLQLIKCDAEYKSSCSADLAETLRAAREALDAYKCKNAFWKDWMMTQDWTKTMLKERKVDVFKLAADFSTGSDEMESVLGGRLVSRCGGALTWQERTIGCCLLSMRVRVCVEGACRLQMPSINTAQCHNPRR